jgi:aryl-alcohol dehydrogenase-like predicted oxidoreductase
MGVIVKRPIANAVWRYPERPKNTYHQPYWDRIQKLDYDFLKSDPAGAVSVALRFTLGLPGVHTAIVGTKKPGRWRENAAILEAGPLPPDQFQAIRSRWREVAEASWVGQI